MKVCLCQSVDLFAVTGEEAEGQVGGSFLGEPGNTTDSCSASRLISAAVEPHRRQQTMNNTLC